MYTQPLLLLEGHSTHIAQEGSVREVNTVVLTKLGLHGECLATLTAHKTTRVGVAGNMGPVCGPELEGCTTLLTHKGAVMGVRAEVQRQLGFIRGSEVTVGTGSLALPTVDIDVVILEADLLCEWFSTQATPKSTSSWPWPHTGWGHWPSPALVFGKQLCRAELGSAHTTAHLVPSTTACKQDTHLRQFSTTTPKWLLLTYSSYTVIHFLPPALQPSRVCLCFGKFCLCIWLFVCFLEGLCKMKKYVDFMKFLPKEVL